MPGRVDFPLSHTDQPVIGLMVDQKPDVLVGLLGILKSGHGFVPLNPDYPTERLDFMVKDCRIEVLVTQSQHLPKAQLLAGMNSSLNISSVLTALKESLLLLLRWRAAPHLRC